MIAVLDTSYSWLQPWMPAWYRSVTISEARPYNGGSDPTWTALQLGEHNRLPKGWLLLPVPKT